MSSKHYVHPRRFSKPKLIPVSSRWSVLITVSIPGRSLSRKKSNPLTKSLKPCRQLRKYSWAEQVLNHVLPAVAGIKPNLTITVERRDDRFWNERGTRPTRTTRKKS